jgi:ankyrin repeat protein
VVKLLLDKSANVNAQSEHYSNVLNAAARFGHIEVAKHLLATSFDMNSLGNYYGSFWASFHLKVIRICYDWLMSNTMQFCISRNLAVEISFSSLQEAGVLTPFSLLLA